MEEKTIPQTKAEDNIENDNNESKLKSTLPRVILCAVVTAAAVIAAYFIFGAVFPDTDASANHNVLVYDYKTLGYYGLSGGKISETEISGDISDAKKSISGSSSAILTKSGNLFIYSENSFTTVSENVLDFAISSKGNAVIYSTKDKKLNLYSADENKGYEVADNADLGYIISPNGNFAAYTATNEAGIKETYIFDKSTQYKAFEKYIPVCISDTGEIYAYDAQSDILYFKNKKETTVISEKADEGFFVNAECNQIMFCSQDKMYISENGSELRRVSSNKVSLITPDGCEAATENENTIFLGVSSLFDCLYYDGANNIFKISTSYNEQESRYSTIRLNTLSENYYLSKNSESVYFIDNKGSFCHSKIQSNAQIKTIAEKVTAFYVAPNEKKAAYITTDKKLYVYQNGQSVFAADNADLVQIGENNTVFFLSDNNLYKLIGTAPELLAKDVQTLYCKPDGMYFSRATEDLMLEVYGGNEKDGYNIISEEGELYIINS